MFKKDDLVVCDFIYSYTDNLTMGNVYKVCYICDEHICVVADNGIENLYESIQFDDIQEIRSETIDWILE